MAEEPSDQRAAAVQAAAELFARKGYRATTLADVAHALKMRKGTLYYYVRSKEELLTSIYTRIFDRIEAEVRPLAVEPISADERLRRMLHAHVRVVATEGAMLSVVFQEEPELAKPVRAAFQRRKRDYERIFEAVIEEGQRAGVMRSLTPRLMVRAALGMCNSLLQWYRPERHDWEAIASELTLLVESGWLADHDQRHGAWTRPRTVDEALAPARETIRRTRSALDELSLDIARAADRLHDGLAVAVSRGDSK